MRYLRASTAAAVAAIAMAVPEARAQNGHTPDGEEPISTTRRTVTVEGKALRYVARAGRIPIRHNETGEVRGQMFFVSYTLERAPGQAPRPITFVWNGGPGSNAALTHLVGFGPRRITPPRGWTPASGTRWRLEDNPGTWLDATDLVFVDPIGTGYSRPVKAEYGADFYNNRGDAESVAEFIRVYRVRFDALDSPLFLGGESFGVTRASGVAAVLQSRGIRVRGTILIGLALPLGTMGEGQRAAFALPTLTAAAFTHRKLAPELQRDLNGTLQQAEQWAEAEYAPALARRDSLSDADRERIVQGLARFTGLQPAQVDRKSLVVGRMQLGNQLLRREGRVVGQYDSRITGPLDTAQAMYDPTKDPSLDDLLDDVMVLRYLRDELGYRNDLQYQGPFGAGYPGATTFRGDWMSVKWRRPGAGGQPAQETPWPPNVPRPAIESPQPLREAMLADRALRVYVGCGIYDLVCDYHGNAWLAKNQEPALRGRVSAHRYGGGHAMYTDPVAHLEMRRDVTQFIRETLAASANR